ncbi:Histidine kinase [Pelomyxa schiedti]|nr:Histidine kinase [Pelomyxa schiedti]
MSGDPYNDDEAWTPPPTTPNKINTTIAANNNTNTNTTARSLAPTGYEDNLASSHLPSPSSSTATAAASAPIINRTAARTSSTKNSGYEEDEEEEEEEEDDDEGGGLYKIKATPGRGGYEDDQDEGGDNALYNVDANGYDDGSGGGGGGGGGKGGGRAAAAAAAAARKPGGPQKGPVPTPMPTASGSGALSHSTTLVALSVHSGSPTDEGFDPHTWNKNFQDGLDALRACEDGTTTALDPNHHDQLVAAWTMIRNAAADFVHAAQVYGKIIIGEQFLPMAQKSIKPAKVGGVAGGEKFIVNGILFKFARDFNNLYGGDDDITSKVAGHELKSCVRFFDAAKSKIRVPLMATVDYLGFRLTAISLIPIIPSSSPVYGSRDGGNTIYHSDPVVNELMKSICGTMNLKEHLCGLKADHLLSGPTDIEVHKGTDGNYYVLDVSRLFPPETPIPTVVRCYLHRLLRPELVLSSTKALSSDALSPFSRADPDNAKLNADVNELTDTLHQKIIPEFAEMLDTKFVNISPSDPATLEISSKMHAAGINLRHYGEVWALCKQSSVKEILKTEIASRAIKVILRKKLRELMKVEKRLSQTPFSHLIVEYINVVLCTVASTKETIIRRAELETRDRLMKTEWENVIHPRMATYTGYNAPWYISMSAEPLGVLRRLEDMMGLQFSTQSTKSFFIDKICGFSFSDRDLLSLPGKITHMNLFSIADGHVLALDASKAAPETTAQFLRLSVDSFKSVIYGNPKSYDLLYSLSMSQLRLGIFTSDTQVINDAYENLLVAAEVSGSVDQKISTAMDTCKIAEGFVQMRKDHHHIPAGGDVISMALQNDCCLALGRNDGTVEKVDITKEKRKRDTLTQEGGRITGIAFQGATMITSIYSDKVLLWNKKDRVKSVIECKFLPRCMCVVEKKLIVGGGRDNKPIGYISMWDLDTVDSAPVTFEGHVGCVVAMITSTLQHLLVSAGLDEVRLWDLESHQLVAKIPITSRVNCITFCQNDSTLITGSDDGLLRMYMLDSTRVPRQIGLIHGHSAAVTCLQVTTAPISLLISGSSDGTLRFWLPSQCSQLGICVGVIHNGPPVLMVQALAQTSPRKSGTGSGPGEVLLLACSSKEVHVHAIQLGALVKSVPDLASALSSLAF